MATTYTNKIIFQDGIYVNGETPLDDRLVLNSVSDLYITAGKKDCVLYQRAYKGMQITIFDNGDPKEFILKDVTPYQKSNGVTVNANNYSEYWELSGKVITERIDALETSLKAADSALSTRLSNEVKELNDTIEQEVETLNEKIDESVETLTSSISSNVNTINKKIASEVDTLEKSIASNVSTLTESINDLDEKIDDEISDRKAAINKINSSIGSTGSKTIAAQLSAIVSDLSDLEKKEIADVKALNTSINSVSTSLTNSLATETSARKAEDSSLTTAINKINTAIGGTGSDSIATQIKNINSSISALQTKEENDVKALNTSINALRTEFDAEVVKLNSADTSLSGDIKSVSDRVAVIEAINIATEEQLAEVETYVDESIASFDSLLKTIDSSVNKVNNKLEEDELVIAAAYASLASAIKQYHTDASISPTISF